METVPGLAPRTYNDLLQEDDILERAYGWFRVWEDVHKTGSGSRIADVFRGQNTASTDKRVPVPDYLICDRTGKPLHRNMLIHGVTASGKTTLCFFLAERFGYDPVLIDCATATLDDAELLLRQVHDTGIARLVSRTNTRPLVVFDNADVIADSSLRDYLIRLLRSNAVLVPGPKNRWKTVPILLTATDPFMARMKNVRDLSLLVNVRTPSVAKLQERMSILFPAVDSLEVTSAVYRSYETYPGNIGKLLTKLSTLQRFGSKGSLTDVFGGALSKPEVSLSRALLLRGPELLLTNEATSFSEVSFNQAIMQKFLRCNNVTLGRAAGSSLVLGLAVDAIGLGPEDIRGALSRVEENFYASGIGEKFTADRPGYANDFIAAFFDNLSCLDSSQFVLGSTSHAGPGHVASMSALFGLSVGLSNSPISPKQHESIYRSMLYPNTRNRYNFFIVRDTRERSQHEFLERASSLVTGSLGSRATTFYTEILPGIIQVMGLSVSDSANLSLITPDARARFVLAATAAEEAGAFRTEQDDALQRNAPVRAAQASNVPQPPTIPSLFTYGANFVITKDEPFFGVPFTMRGLQKGRLGDRPRGSGYDQRSAATVCARVTTSDIWSHVSRGLSQDTVDLLRSLAERLQIQTATSYSDVDVRVGELTKTIEQEVEDIAGKRSNIAETALVYTYHEGVTKAVRRRLLFFALWG